MVMPECPVETGASSGRVNRLLGGDEGHALLAQGAHDVLQVVDGAGDPVNAGDDQFAAGLQEGQQDLKLLPVLAA